MRELFCMPLGVKKYVENDGQVKFSFSFIFYEIFKKKRFTILLKFK